MTARIRVFSSIVPAAAALLLLLGTTASAQQGKAAEKDTGAQAMAIITRMSDFLAATKQFSLTADIGYDIVQDWGQKIEFGETRVLTVRRPDRLRVDTTDRDGSTSGVVFDGKEITFFDLTDKVYATAAKPGSINDAISYLANDLGMRLPMSAILSGRLPQIVKNWANDTAYVDQSTIAGVACDHITLRGDWEDIQMWIARGDRPLLQRMVITYKRAEGQPQFLAQVRDWNLSPDVPDSFFSFTPPAGLAKIAFVPRKEGSQVGALDAKGSQP